MISIENKVNESIVNYGLVNNILSFNKLSAEDVIKADLEFAGYKMTIRPAPDRSFYYNLKEWISAVFSAKGYADDVNIDIEQFGMVYDVTDFALLKGNIKITFWYATGTTEVIYNSVHFLNSVKQIEDYSRRQLVLIGRDSLLPLAPLSPNSNRDLYVDYWAGYPLDITIHKSGIDAKTVFRNNGTATEYEVTTKPNELVSRYVLSDGRDDISLLELMNLANGENHITVSSGDKSFEMTLNRIPVCKYGVYVKWLNNEGGYSYFFFGKSERSRKKTDLGDIENDYLNLDETVSPSISIGVNSREEIKVVAMSVSPERQNYLNDIVDSPAIYMFTGLPYNKNTFNDWLNIRLKTSDVKVQNFKQELNNYNFVFELPQRNTRKR